MEATRVTADEVKERMDRGEQGAAMKVKLKKISEHVIVWTTSCSSE